jgi:hypothetical protein
MFHRQAAGKSKAQYVLARQVEDQFVLDIADRCGEKDGYLGRVTES